MGNNAFLDIAIGLVLMYLVLSLIATVVNEYVATAINLRANTLARAVKSMLDNVKLRKDFYNHGLIDGTKNATGEHASYFSGQTFAMAVLGSVDAAKSAPSFANIKATVQAMPDCNIRDVLLTQLTKANGDFEALRNGVATYFDSAMDRVTGLYKRYLKWISLAVGCVIVLALNADSIKVGAALWSDASLRAQMVESAKDFSQKNAKPAAPAADSNAAATPESTAAFANRLSTLDATIRPLPIGWKTSTIQYISSYYPYAGIGWLFSPAGAGWLLMKIVGLAITALAISLGAPFWFDLLSKFMNIRGAGVKPDPTKPEDQNP